MRPQKRGSEGPIRRELKTLLIAKTAEVKRLASSLPELTKRGLAARSVEFEDSTDRLIGVIKEAVELCSWLIPPLHVMSDSERSRTLDAAQAIMLAEDHTPLEVVENLKIAQQKPHGRPATKRHIAVVALDTYLENPKVSWPQVFREVCNCGRETHGPACQEQLRQQVQDLKAVLGKFGIQMPKRIHKAPG